jgi:hypothetical protein
MHYHFFSYHDKEQTPSPLWILKPLPLSLSSPLPLHYQNMTYRGDEPLRVASSSNAVSTTDAGRWTYLTTDPRMKTFFTATCTHQRCREEVFTR